MIEELPSAVFVLKVGETYYSEFGRLCAFLSAADAAGYRNDVEPFAESSLGIVEVPTSVVFHDVKGTGALSHLYLVVCSWDDYEQELESVVVYDPAATIN